MSSACVFFICLLQSAFEHTDFVGMSKRINDEKITPNACILTEKSILIHCVKLHGSEFIMDQGKLVNLRVHSWWLYDGSLKLKCMGRIFIHPHLTPDCFNSFSMPYNWGTAPAFWNGLDYLAEFNCIFRQSCILG